MKLTARQSKIKRLFRDKLLHLWPVCAPMWLVFSHVNDEMGEKGIWRESGAIPSIGTVFVIENCSGWLAKHYPKTSEALFNGCNAEKALIVWGKEKRIN